MRLRIASWNIRKAVGLDWRRDPGRVLDVLDRIGADAVLLQEADRRLPPRPPALPPAAMAAAGWAWIDADPATPSIGHHGNALLLGPGLAPAEVVALDLPGLEPRGAVLLRLRAGGRDLTLGALHLGLRRRDRVRQVRAAVHAARGLGGPAILGGDLNEWRGAGLPLPEGWRHVAPGPSFHADLPLLALDRFLVSPGVGIAGAGIVPRHAARRASDHLPVWIDVDP